MHGTTYGYCTVCKASPCICNDKLNTYCSIYLPRSPYRCLNTKDIGVLLLRLCSRGNTADVKTLESSLCCRNITIAGITSADNTQYNHRIRAHCKCIPCVRLHIANLYAYAVCSLERNPYCGYMWTVSFRIVAIGMCDGSKVCLAQRI